MVPIELLPIENGIFLSNLESERISENVSSVCTWMGEKCRRFSRLANQGVLLTLDAVFFAGKVWNGIPDAVTNTAFAMLNGVGFLSFPYLVDYINKSVKDSLFGKLADDLPSVIISAAKVMELASTAGLIIAGFGASLAGWGGMESLQKAAYDVMMPWGEMTVALGLGLTFAYMYMNHQALKRYEPEASPEHCASILDSLLKQIDEQDPKALNDRKYAALLRLCMDNYTLEHLLKEMEKVTEEDMMARKDLLRVVIANIETQQNVNLSWQAILYFGGFGLRIIQKWFRPDSYERAGINLAVAIAYTAKILVETLREVEQRHKISLVANSV